VNVGTKRSDPDRFFRGWRLWIVALVFWTMVGILAFAYQYLDVFVRGRTEPFTEKLVEELTGGYGTGLLFPFIVWLARALRGRGLRWYGILSAHLAAIPVYSALHTTWNWLSRILTYEVLNLGRYDYGIMSIRYVMELPNDVLSYATMGLFVYLFDHYREAKNDQVRLAQLEAELSGARLKVLTSQLQPHFLFNALNTISSVMYKDVAAADRVLAQLGNLLRRALRSSEAHEVSLHEEIQTLELYLDIMRARFSDRLTVSVDVSPELDRVLVPQLLLQPLVENALRHGDPGVGRHMMVGVRAETENGHLRLTVEDNGPGLPPGFEPMKGNGVGLRNTARRLEHLYGSNQEMRLENRPDGGLVVTVALPLRIEKDQ